MMSKNLFQALSVCMAIMICSCAQEDQSKDNLTDGRKLRMLTIQQTSTNEEVGTRSILIDKGENGIYASWEMGDEVTIYNRTYPSAGYATVKATSSTKLGTFTGEVDCEVGDVLRLFYPVVSNESSITDNSGTLTLKIGSQKGTLEDIQQNYDFNYGEAVVTAVTDKTATADAGQTENLMVICKFTFKSGKDYLKNITDITINGVAPQATYTLSARSTPALTPATPSTIQVKADGADNCVYVALFPGETTPTFTVTAAGKIYEGELPTSNLDAGRFYDVVVETTYTGNAPNININNDYVEVCGIKWAKGILQYDPVNGGDEGFVENWRIAPTQWDYAGYDENTNPDTNQIKDNFAFSIVGDKAYDYHRGPERSTVDICMKLWYESIGDEYETDFAHATRGDLAYWASNGQYRMPRQSDLMVLINDASRQYGYINSPGGASVYGYLFTTPQGERTVNTTATTFSEDDLDNGVFLPMGSYVKTYYKYDYETSPAKTTYTTNFTPRVEGIYLSSGIGSTSSASASLAKAFKMTETSVQILDAPLQENISRYPRINEYNYYYYKIRPIWCE